jgi:D-tyrosyl-tRNA(Tyr) deacylase
VLIDDQVVGAIGEGWSVLLGVGHDDDEATATALVDRIVNLRAFEDADGKMNLSASDVRADFLVVSQFTLYADLSRGRRPSFVRAAPPDRAAPLVEFFAEQLRTRGFNVATGRFGAVMDVELVNHGPVTIALSTDAWS